MWNGHWRRAVEDDWSRIATPEPLTGSARCGNFRHVSAMLSLTNRSVDAIIGYGPDGLPS